MSNNILILLIIVGFFIDLLIAHYFSTSKNRFIKREKKTVEMATFPRRFIAITIDGILSELISLIFTTGYAGLMIKQADKSTLALNSLLLTGFAFLAYFTVTEWLWGQTLGKKIMGIRVVNKDDLGKISFLQALYRNLLRLVDGLFGYLVGGLIAYYSPEWQRLGDSFGKTLVIKSIVEEKPTLDSLIDQEKQEELNEAPNYTLSEPNQPLIEQPTQASGDVIKCPKCQAENPVNADFCRLCYQKF